LTLVDSDINSSGIVSNRSSVTFNATAGTTYHVAVDGYNGASSRITLSLNSSGTVVRPRVTLLNKPNGTAAQLTILAEANRNYDIEYSADLRTWNPLTSVTTSGTGAASFSDSGAAGSPKRYYRVRVP
jgi:hypothetical protein